MLKRFWVGLLICQLAGGAVPALAAPSDADSIRSMHAMALQSSARGDVDNALTTFDSAIRLAERTFGKDSSYVADLCYDAGVAALRTDRYQKAEDCLTRAVQINPNARQARLELAEYYRKRGRCTEAKQQLQKVLSRDPSNLEARQLLALTLQKEGNAGKATQEFYRLQAAAAGEAVPVDSIAAAEPSAAVTAMVSPPAPAQAEPVANTNPLASLLHNIAPAKAPEPVKPVKPAKASKAPKAERPLSRKQMQEKRRAEQRADQQRRAAEQKKAAKHQKHEKRAPQQIEDSGTAFNTPARLHSKAVLLTPVNKHGSASSESSSEAPPPSEPPKKVESRPARNVDTRDDGPEEEGFGGTPIRKQRKQAPAPVAAPPAQQPAPVMPRIEPARKPRPGLVPPPPPVVPSFGIPAFMPPPPQPRPVVKKPVERPKPEVIDDNAKPTDEDAEFLLDWAGKKKKKK